MTDVERPAAQLRGRAFPFSGLVLPKNLFRTISRSDSVESVVQPADLVERNKATKRWVYGGTTVRRILLDESPRVRIGFQL